MRAVVLGILLAGCGSAADNCPPQSGFALCGQCSGTSTSSFAGVCRYCATGSTCSGDLCADWGSGLSCVPAGGAPVVCQVVCWACSGTNAWGALAYSATTGACGDSHGFSSEAAAESSAVSACGQADCVVVSGPNGNSGFSNQCAALAAQTPFSVGGAWATAGRQSATDAENASVIDCEK